MNCIVWFLAYVFSAFAWGFFTDIISNYLFPDAPTWKKTLGFLANVVLFPLSLALACFRATHHIELIEKRLQEAKE
jgi:hypothetical protein